jgi:hypothetical protein
LENKSKTHNAEKWGPKRRGWILLSDKDIRNLKSSVSSFEDAVRPKYTSDLTREASWSRPRTAGVVEGFSSPPKSSRLVVRNLSTPAVSLTYKRASSRAVTASLVQKKREASEFLSILEGKGRLMRREAVATLLGRKIEGSSEGGNRLSYAQRLLLFKTLLRKPLPFLEVHVRFGVSKSTMTSLVKNGFLIEMWGPKAVGVRLRLSNKGMAYLKELEAASKCEPNMRKNAIIRLKRSTML